MAGFDCPCQLEDRPCASCDFDLDCANTSNMEQDEDQQFRRQAGYLEPPLSLVYIVEDRMEQAAYMLRKLSQVDMANAFFNANITKYEMGAGL